MANPTPKAKDSKAAKQKSPKHDIKLTGGEGETARVRARQEGSKFVVRATITSQEGDKKVTTRGARSEHPNLEEAKTQAEKLADAMVAKGWSKRSKKGSSKSDAFGLDNLPSPKAKAALAAKK